MKHNTAQICLNGHIITENALASGSTKAFCPDCGKPTISHCPTCGNHIPGSTDDDEIICIGFPMELPAYCEYCGKPYPWTESALTNAKSLILEEEELSQLERENLINSLPDIMTETPNTNLAIIRIKKCLVKAGKFTAEGIRQFVIDFGCELAKKQLDL